MALELNGVSDERVFSANDSVTNDGQTTNESTTELVGNADRRRYAVHAGIYYGLSIVSWIPRTVLWQPVAGRRPR